MLGPYRALNLLERGKRIEAPNGASPTTIVGGAGPIGSSRRQPTCQTERGDRPDPPFDELRAGSASRGISHTEQSFTEQSHRVVKRL